MKTRLSSLGIGARLILIGIAAILALCAIVAATVFALGSVNRSVQFIYDHPLQVKPAAIDAAYRTERMIQNLQSAVMGNGEQDIYRAIDAAQREYEGIVEALNTVRDRIYGEEGKDLERRARSRLLAWTAERNGVVSAVMRHDHDEALSIMGGAGSARLGELRESLDAVVDYATSRAAEFKDSADRDYAFARTIVALVFSLSVAAFLALMYFGARSVLGLIRPLADTMARIEETGVLAEAPVTGGNEISSMARVFNDLIRRLRSDSESKDLRAELIAELSEQTAPEALAEALAKSASGWIGADAGVVYALSPVGDGLILLGGWGAADARRSIGAGEGPIGQTALDKRLRVLTGEETSGRRVETGMATLEARSVIAVPLMFGGETVAVAEYVALAVPAEESLRNLQTLHDAIAPYLRALVQRERIERLHQEATEARGRAESETARATAQAEALVEANVQLEEQRYELEQQSEELRSLNEELLENAAQLRTRRIEAEEHSKKLEAASRYKSDFMSRMSHELRTPLNSLLILARELEENRSGNLNGEQTEAARIILRSGKDLLSLIDSILDLSRIESGKMRVDVAELNVPGLVDRMRDVFTPIARDKGIALGMLVEEGAPKRLWSDSVRIERVLSNLLSNALKFTERGTVELRVSGDDRGAVFRVSDTGIGIPAEMREVVFLPFEQADTSISRKYGGSGLGLAIAREISTLLDGSLKLSEREGGGSVFTFCAPDLSDPAAGRQAEEPAVGRIDAAEAPGARTGKNGKAAVLVIEDDELHRASIIEILRRDGIAAKAVASGKDALRELSAEPYACAVVDLGLPDIEGIALLEELSPVARSRGTAIIVNSAREVDGNEYLRMRELSDSFIVKGAAASTRLLGEIESFLSGAAKRRVAEAAPPTNAVLSGRTALIVDDDMRNLFALSRVLDGVGMRVLKADSAQRALEVLSANPEISVVLTDLMMPGVSGLDLIRSIRSDVSKKGLRIIAVTAKAAKADRDACIEAGADDYIAKPIDVDRLISLLQVWLYE